MRYTLVGRKIPHVGKTLWEIVGNLKNFGVGRLVVKSSTLSDPSLSFCKIVKVLPIPAPDKPFLDRVVCVWFDEVYKGKRLGIVKRMTNTDLPQYQLIPKAEEEKYLKEAEKLQDWVKIIKKYCPWPPLYKQLWEENNKMSAPKLELKICEYKTHKIILEEGEVPKTTCSLYKSDKSVDDMYKEIVELKKFIKSKTAAQQE